MMSQYQPVPEGKDPQLWETARQRAGFKSHFITYILVNGFLWAIWYFKGASYNDGNIPWPLWSTLGWGIGLAAHYVRAYVNPKSNAVEREYEKLKQEKNNHLNI